jgi:Trypsin/PEP-CTERM motif
MRTGLGFFRSGWQLPVLLGALVLIGGVRSADAEMIASSTGGSIQQYDANSGLSLMSVGTIRHDVPDASYLGLASSFPSVGFIAGPGFFGSGVLIAGQWVLTAAHMVDAPNPASDWSFIINGDLYTGAEIFVFPAWISDLMAGNDIGLLKLDAPVVGVTPATRYTGSSEVGEVGTHAGFGLTGTGLTGATTVDFKKRAGDNMIDALGTAVGWSSNILFDDFDNPLSAADNFFGSATPLGLEYLIAPGDSGGGLFADFGSGYELVGIHSFLATIDGNNDADYGDLSGSIRVASYNAWIDDTIAVPEPGTLALLFTGALAFGVRRFRKQVQQAASLAPA